MKDSRVKCKFRNRFYMGNGMIIRHIISLLCLAILITVMDIYSAAITRRAPGVMRRVAVHPVLRGSGVFLSTYNVPRERRVPVFDTPRRTVSITTPLPSSVKNQSRSFSQQKRKMSEKRWTLSQIATEAYREVKEGKDSLTNNFTELLKNDPLPIAKDTVKEVDYYFYYLELCHEHGVLVAEKEVNKFMDRYMELQHAIQNKINGLNDYLKRFKEVYPWHSLIFVKHNIAMRFKKWAPASWTIAHLEGVMKSRDGYKNFFNALQAKKKKLSKLDRYYKDTFEYFTNRELY